MATLNADLPRFFAYVRAEFLYDHQSHHGEFVPVCVFGVSSVFGRAVGFHCQTEQGALIWRLPVHALAARPEVPAWPLEELELWDCASPEIAVHTFEYLAETRCAVMLPTKGVQVGTYLCTLDWHGTPYSNDPGDGGHKCAHLVELDAGLYCLQPNNRFCAWEPSWVTEPFVASREKPDYITNTQKWKCESKNWATRGDGMFYEVGPASISVSPSILTGRPSTPSSTVPSTSRPDKSSASRSRPSTTPGSRGSKPSSKRRRGKRKGSTGGNGKRSSRG